MIIVVGAICFLIGMLVGIFTAALMVSAAEEGGHED